MYLTAARTPQLYIGQTAAVTTREETHVVCSVDGDLKVSKLVAVPNFLVSALLPPKIFEA